MSRVYFLDVLNTLKGPIQRMEIEKQEETIAMAPLARHSALPGREATQGSVI